MSATEHIGYSICPWKLAWLQSRTLFELFYQGLPRRGEPIGNGIYLYNLFPQGVSWSVWGWVGESALIVGYPPWIGMSTEGNPHQLEELKRDVLVFVERLASPHPPGIGAASYIADNVCMSARYGAVRSPTGAIDIAWATPGDWCGQGIVDWFPPLPTAYDPYMSNAPLPEPFALQAIVFSPAAGDRGFALPSTAARAYLSWCQRYGVTVERIVPFDRQTATEWGPGFPADADECRRILSGLSDDRLHVIYATGDLIPRERLLGDG